MRLTLFLLVISAFCAFSNSYAQKTKLDINIQNSKVKDVLDAIETQSEFFFMYNNKQVDVERKVDIDAKSTTVDIVLQKLFTETNINYKIVNRQILLYPKDLPNLAEQQDKKLTGKITDSNGASLPGVSVVVKGTTIGITSDNDGNFSLVLPNDAKILLFSFIGMKTQEIEIGTKLTFNVTLEEETIGLQEIVAIGYGTLKKNDITGSITTITASEMNKGIYSSPVAMLQGKVPGLNITASGDPTATPSITLRGPSTLRTGAAMEPFYVIDGVPGASIESVAAEDIVSMDVLRDASSTAIYGSRAANGVIMITTKRAKAGQSYVNFSSYAAVENVSHRIDMLSATELRDYLKVVNKVPFDDNGGNTNWQDEVTRTGISQSHSLSFGGGSDKTTYGVSIKYLENQGVIKTSSLDRWIGRMNVEQKAFNDKLTVGFNLTNATTNKQFVRSDVYANMHKYLPTVSVLKPDGTYFENTQNSNYYNPVAMLNNDLNFLKTINQLANFTLKVNIMPWLTYNASASLQTTENQNNQYSKAASTLHLSANGYAIRSEYTNKSTLAENYFTFDKVYGLHSLKVLAGYSWQEDKINDGFQNANSNFISDDLLYNNLSLGSSPDKVTTADRFGTATIQTLRIISFYSRMNYQFNNKYLLQATIRRDGSSAFGANHQWGTFPSASVGWKITNESFMSNLKAVSDLKLRVGYGISGNSLGFDPMISKLKYGVTGTTYINGIQLQAVGVTQNENPDLKWETTAMANVGLDFGFLENRITGTIEAYSKQTSDLIWNYPVSTTRYLYSSLIANVGKISNKGVEFQINATPIRTRDFQWTTSFNISHNVNKVVSLSNDLFPTFTEIRTAGIGGKGQSGNPSQILKEGEPIGTFFVRQYAGRNIQGISMFYKANGDTSKVVTVEDFKQSGSAQPKFMFGWSNTFTYKNFDFSFFLRGVSGNKILNATLASLNDVNNASNNNIPRFSLGEPATDINSFYNSTRYIENGSYIRMDNATLGYNFKIKSAKIKSARLYITTNNLFVITKYRGIDPEINLGGIEPGIDNNNFYPKTRTFMLGININL